MSNYYPSYRRRAAALPAYRKRRQYAYQAPIVVAPKPTRYSASKPRNNPASSRSKSSSGIARKIGAMGGTAIGGYLGGPTGAAIGSAVGSKAGELFSSITGMGDYSISYNSVVNPNQTPIFKQKGRSVFISHREYIQDVITSPTAGAFQITSYDLNPALSTTFPWLATIAQNFEQYRIHGMVFHYKSNSADALNSVNTALGTVIMATQYNILLDPFKNKQEMENYEFGCSTRPSADCLHPVECDPKVTSFGPVFDVKLGGNDKGDDRLYCPGRFSLATVGQQGSSVNIGELWVTYDIEFFKPRMGDIASEIDHWRGVSTFSTTQPFGLAEDRNVSESSDFVTCNISNNTIYWDVNFTGKVQITAVWKPPTAVTIPGPIQPPTAVASGGVSAFPVFSGGFATSQPGPLTDVSAMVFTGFYSIVNGGTITFSGGTYTGITRFDLIITTLPNTFQLYEPENDDF